MPLISSNDSEVVYARTAGSRRFSALATPFIFAMFAALLIVMWPHLPRPADRSPLELLQPYGVLLLMETFGALVVLSGLYGMGPEDLIFDLRTRTYRFRRGLPLLARWKTGPYSDFAGVAVRRQAGKSVVFYKVTIVWRDTGRGLWSVLPHVLREMFHDVQIFSTQSEAEAIRQVNATVEQLGLPHADDATATAPEEVRRRSTRALLIGVVVCAFFLIGFTAPVLLLQGQLDRQGTTVQGVVTQQRRGSKSSYVGFSYQVNGRTLRGQDEVTWNTLQTINIGDPVDVTYLPDYPKTSRTAYSNTRRSAILQLEVYGGWLVLGTVYSLYRLRGQPNVNRRT